MIPFVCFIWIAALSALSLRRQRFSGEDVGWRTRNDIVKKSGHHLGGNLYAMESYQVVKKAETSMWSVQQLLETAANFAKTKTKKKKTNQTNQLKKKKK